MVIKYRYLLFRKIPEFEKDEFNDKLDEQQEHMGNDKEREQPKMLLIIVKD